MRIAVALLIPTVLAGCGPTIGELLKQNQVAIDTVRANLEKSAAAIDAFPTLDPSSKCTAPEKLSFDTKAGGNTDWIMYPELREKNQFEDEYANPPITVEKDPIDFYFSTVLGLMLHWTHPKGKWATDPESRKERASKPAQQSFEQFKKLKYALVVKTRKMDRSKGEAIVDTFLVDIAAAKPICGFSVVAQADPSLGSVDYDVVKRQGGKETVVRSGTRDEFGSAIWSSAQSKVYARAKSDLGVDSPK
jgi:hypothetical protein